MPLAKYYDLEQRDIDIVKEALRFLKSKVRQYGDSRKKGVDSFFHPVIDTEIENEVDRIEELDFFLDVQLKRVVLQVEDSVLLKRMNMIRSALEIYLRETKEAKTSSSVTGNAFDSKIQKIKRVLDMGIVKRGKPDLYDKYWRSAGSGERVKVFLSYSHNDRALAGKLGAFLKRNEIDVFLAHEEIEVSKEWRKEIFRHLESCTVLLALLTPHFEGSAWANQEVGYAMRRAVPVAPLIVGKADIKRFGCLESFQGITLEEGNPEESFEEVLNIVKTRAS